MRFFIVFMATVTVGCQRAQVPSDASRGASASEVFRLRSECAKLGEKLESESAHGAALQQDVTTNYNPKTNRCYALLTVQNADITKEGDVNRYLYDAQTRQLLAFTRFFPGNSTGSIFVYPRPVSVSEGYKSPSYEETDEFIGKMMLDDHKQ
jgi:hypothetical protein